MHEKFKEIPVEADTKILSRKETKLGPYDAVLEEWFWDGIKAKSYIFANEDIEGVSEEELKKLVNSEPTTYKKKEKYTFVNFDFRY